MGNTLPKLHKVIGITYNNSPSVIYGEIITLSDAYHKATKWFLHHLNGLVLFKRYIQNLDILELSILIAFSLFITIWRGMYAQVRNVIARCEQCDRMRTSFSF
jgi:hypothetical protein